MLDPIVVDELIATYTANALRSILLNCELTANDRASIIAAIYYIEGTEGND